MLGVARQPPLRPVPVRAYRPDRAPRSAASVPTPPPVNRATFSSGNERWGTPPEFVFAVERQYNVRFILDMTADAAWRVTAGTYGAGVADRTQRPVGVYVGPDNADPLLRDALSVDWSYAWRRALARAAPPGGWQYTTRSGCRVAHHRDGWRPAMWMNPPYTRYHTRFFVEACARAPLVLAAAGLAVSAFSLIFARTETRFWQDTVMPYGDVIDLLRGRMVFLDPSTGQPKADAKGHAQGAPAPSALIEFNHDRPNRVVRPWDWKGSGDISED